MSKHLVKKASLIFQIKAEIIKREEMAEDVIVSKLKIIKIGQDYLGDEHGQAKDNEKTMNHALMQNFKIMSEFLSNQN